MDRKQLIEEAIHSGEMEGAYVSAEFREDADEYVKGDISIEELMRRTKRRWIPATDEGVHHPQAPCKPTFSRTTTERSSR